MDKIIVLQNDMSQGGQRCLHVMSNEPVDPAQLRRLAQVDQAVQLEVKTSEDEIRLHHLTAMWLAREPVYFIFPQEGTGKEHPMVVWAMEPGQRISESAIDAALLFFASYGFWPSAAWLRTWPKGLMEDDAYIPITEDCGMDLFAVRWAPEGCVVVGGGFNRRS